MSVSAANSTENVRSPKSFASYMLNKCIVGYGIVNGIINAGIFMLMHLGNPDVQFGFEGILFDMALTGVLLGVILFACVVPLTKADLRKGSFSHEGGFAKAIRLIPRKYVSAICAIGLAMGVFIVAASALAAVFLPLPLSVMQMMLFKGCGCALTGGLAGYLTISYATRAYEEAIR